VDDFPYILLVEDCLTQALHIKHLVQRVSGYPVQVARDGFEGWKQACLNPPRLILLDINLPGIDGFRLLSRLKHSTATATIPVLMMTSCDSVGDVEHAIALNADGYIFKEDLFASKDAVARACADIAHFLGETGYRKPGPA